MEKYLISGAIGYSIWDNLDNNKRVMILHDNHSTETYCKNKTSLWISDLFNSLDSNEWEIILEEPEKKYLKALRSLWITKHVKDVRSLTKRNIKRVDIRFNEHFANDVIPSWDVIENTIRYAPNSYVQYIRNIWDYFDLYNHRRKHTNLGADDVLYPGCIVNWSYCFPYMTKKEAIQCFKDFVFDGHILSSIIESTKHCIVYAGSWHCRSVENWLKYENMKQVSHRNFPLGHRLETNCIEVIKTN